MNRFPFAPRRSDAMKLVIEVDTDELGKNQDPITYVTDNLQADLGVSINFTSTEFNADTRTVSLTFAPVQLPYLSEIVQRVGIDVVGQMQAYTGEGDTPLLEDWAVINTIENKVLFFEWSKALRDAMFASVINNIHDLTFVRGKYYEGDTSLYQ